MYFKKLKKLLSGVLVGAMMIASISAMPVMAADNYDVKLIIKNVTETDTNSDTLTGEAKFKISMSGITDKLTYAQVLLGFESDSMTFKSVEYIHGNDNALNVNVSNRVIAEDKIVMPGFACATSPIEDSDGIVDMFIITFEGGSEGDSVTLTPELSDTFAGIAKASGTPGSSYTASLADGNEYTANASTTTNTGITAKINISMDAVKSIRSLDEQNPITVSLRSDSGVTTEELTLDTTGSTPILSFEEKVVNKEYTLEIKANGYKTYSKTLSGNSLKNMTISTDEFMPGDVNADDKIDLQDYTLFMSVYDNELDIHPSLTDYDRNGITNYLDLNALKTSLASTKANGKINDTTGTKALTVSADDTSVKVDDTFTLTLKAEDVYTYFVNGTWDNTVATLESATVKGTTEDNYKALNVSKDGKFSLMNTVNSADSNDKIYELEFKAKKAGSFSLTFNDSYTMDKVSDISDADVNKINVTNATVTISAKEGGSGGGTGGGGGGTGGGGGGGTGGGSTPSVTTPSTTTPSTITPSTTTPSNETFTDIDNYAWAKDSIYMLKDKGIISGVSATEYAPANNIKRGDFILILTRMLNLTTEYSENFADVPESAYYYDALGKAKAAGIATGDGINFMPENSITRQDLITLAYRAFLNAGYITENTDTTALDNFNDRAEISDYAVNAMASMVNAGIIKGSDNGGVNPKGNATRAEVAVMCARLVELMNK